MPGRPTTWLVRGILEEWGRLVGLVGTLEYSLADARLDPRGEVWVQAEDDPSQGLGVAYSLDLE